MLLGMGRKSCLGCWGNKVRCGRVDRKSWNVVRREHRGGVAVLAVSERCGLFFGGNSHLSATCIFYFLLIAG